MRSFLSFVIQINVLFWRGKNEICAPDVGLAGLMDILDILVPFSVYVSSHCQLLFAMKCAATVFTLFCLVSHPILLFPIFCVQKGCRRRWSEARPVTGVGECSDDWDESIDVRLIEVRRKGAVEVPVRGSARRNRTAIHLAISRNSNK